MKIFLMAAVMLILTVTVSEAGLPQTPQTGYFNLSQQDVRRNFKAAKQYKKPEQKPVDSSKLTVVTPMKACMDELRNSAVRYAKPYKECLKRQERLKREPKLELVEEAEVTVQVENPEQIKSVEFDSGVNAKEEIKSDNKVAMRIKSILRQRQKVERHIGNE